VAFFEPVNAPFPRFDEYGIPLPWEEGLGQTVFKDVVLAKGIDGLLMLRSLIAFPRVMTLTIVALFRNPLVKGDGTLGDNCPTFSPQVSGEPLGTGIVLIGLRFSDGTRLRNLDDRGSVGNLEGLGGCGFGFTAQYEFFTLLPPPGELELWTAWPAAGIPETRILLDATQIVKAAGALEPPWS
jgi:hypothetical protein